MSEAHTVSGFRAVRKGLEIYIERENPPFSVKVASGKEEDMAAYLMHAEWAAAKLGPDVNEDDVRDVCSYLDYYPNRLLMELGRDFDYAEYAYDSFLEDTTEFGGDPWCMKCGERATGLLPGGPRDTLADGSPFCFHCVKEADSGPDPDSFDDEPDFESLEEDRMIREQEDAGSPINWDDLFVAPKINPFEKLGGWSSMQDNNLRDWFAGMALQALIGTTAHPAASGDLTSGTADDPQAIAADARSTGWSSEAGPAWKNGKKCTWLELITSEAYEFANMMMETRKIEQTHRQSEG